VYLESTMTLDELQQALHRAHTTLQQQAELITRLQARIAELEQQLSEAQRRGQRQATPFAKGPPTRSPKKPGQKAGHRAAHRPTPEHIDRVLEAPLPPHCPNCGGAVTEERIQYQYQEDIPRPVRPLVTQFNVHVGHCTRCTRRVQGRHPEQTSDALGRAAVQLGPNVLSLAAELKHHCGVAHGKSAVFIAHWFGLQAQAASFMRAGQRLARVWQPTYHWLIVVLRASEVVHSDETGWKVAGQAAWLWVFTNTHVTVYVIEPSRAHRVIEAVLGADFAGVLVSDCFLAYDPLQYDKAKCLGHLLRRCAQVRESGNRAARQFSEQVARLLRAAITLKARRTQLSAQGYQVACGRLEAALDRLLDKHYRQADTARLAKLLRKQRAHLFTCLYVEAVDATNNAAERALRPAVIIRKTNGCNRRDTGAQTHATLSSVMRTCQQQGRDFSTETTRLLQNPAPAVIALTSADSSPPLLPVTTSPPAPSQPPAADAPLSRALNRR
jgi:transposase